MVVLSCEAALSHHVGVFGRGQIGLASIASFAFFCQALVVMLMVFTSQDPVTRGDWKCTSATDATCAPVRAQREIDRDDFCGLPRSSWEYTSKRFSLLSDYDLVCGKEWQVDLVNALFFVGFAIGGVCFGAAADRWGRRPTLYGTVAASAVCTAAAALSPSFWLYAVLRVAVAAPLQGLALALVLLVTEVVGADYVGRMGIVTQVYYVIGECVLALMAWLIPGWRALTLACAAACAAFLLTWPLVLESPRWLIAHGNQEEAVAVLLRLAKWNGREVTAADLQELQLQEEERAAPLPSPPPPPQQQYPHQPVDLSGCNTSAMYPNGSAAGVDSKAGNPSDGGAWPVAAAGSRQPQLAVAYSGSSITMHATAHGRGAGHASGALAVPLVATAAAAAAAPAPAPWHAQAADAGAATAEAAQPLRANEQPSASCATAPARGAAAPVTLMQAVRHRPLQLYFLILTYALCATVLGYYGVGFGLGGLPGSIYLNFFLVCAAELPASVVTGLLIDRTGRTLLVIGGMLLSGVACIVVGNSTGSAAAQILFAMIGKSGCAAAWCVLYVYIAEVFPTPVRGALTGVIFQGAQAGGVAGPFIFMIGRRTGSEALPFTVMGVCGLVGAVLCLRLPETCNLPMPDTLEDVERHADRTALVLIKRNVGSCLRRRRAGGSAAGMEAEVGQEASAASQNAAPFAARQGARGALDAAAGGGAGGGYRGGHEASGAEGHMPSGGRKLELLPLVNGTVSSSAPV